MTSCSEPICDIRSADVLDTCGKCEVLPDGTFSYDCAEVLPNISCPVRWPNATCTNHGNEFVNGLSEAILDESVDTADQSNSGQWTWTLEDIDPTYFNVLSDIFAYVTNFLTGLAVASLYPAVMTWRLHEGKGRVGGSIPLEHLGKMPGDFVTAASQAFWTIRDTSLLAVVLVVTMALVAFSHTIADSGLTFTSTISKKGKLQPVLYTASHARNPNRPLQTLGDPPTPRTSIDSNLVVTRDEDALADSYMAAVTLIARGRSPFVTSTSSVEVWEDSSWDIPGSLSVFVDNDRTPLSQLAQEIPLNCDSLDFARIEQFSITNTNLEVPVGGVDNVPNCSFAGLRSSGVFGANTTAAEILEYTTITNIRIGPKAVYLRNGTDLFQEFEVTPKSKQLARDRLDWREGRVFYDVDGISIGNLEIDFGTVVLASGTAGLSTLEEVSPRNYYGLVAEIVGGCPPRPSTLTTKDTQCMALVTLLCDLFPEDIAPIVHSVYYPQDTSSTCNLWALQVVWGRNFVVDSQLVAVVGGIYGVVQPSLTDRSHRIFARYGILASLFALGTVEERFNVEQVVRATVNSVYVVFMLLPIAIWIAIIGLTYGTRQRTLPVPESTWELMVMAKESSLIPERQDKSLTFPPPDKELSLRVTRNEEGSLILGIVRKPVKPEGSTESDDGVNTSANTGMVVDILSGEQEDAPMDGVNTGENAGIVVDIPSGEQEDAPMDGVNTRENAEIVVDIPSGEQDDAPMNGVNTRENAGIVVDIPSDEQDVKV